MRIGFVGVGVMGHGMASRLLAAGYALTAIAHRNRAPVEDLVAKGAKEAADLAALVAASDTVMLCLSNSDVVEQVIGEMRGHLRRGMMVIDTGTSRPESCRRLAEDLGTIGVDFVEAPVTGGIKQAAAGELGALVGASEDAYRRAEPVLQVTCGTVHRFGAPGAGNTAKLINNFMVFGIAALVIEAFTKADRANIDWQKLYDVVICGSADSGVLRRIIGSAVEGDFKGYVFDVAGALKDMRYFCDLPEAIGAETPLDQAVRDIYETAVADGHGQRLLSELLAPGIRRP